MMVGRLQVRLCVLFDVRYPHELLCVMDKPSIAMLWIRYTLWIPLYVVSAATEGECIIVSACET